MADKNMEAQISVEFEEATSRQSLNSGDKINALWGKVKRWLTDLKTVAFSGSYNDLSDKPTIPTVGNGTVTIKQGGTNKGSFTMNQSGNTTIELTDNDTTYNPATQSTNGLMLAEDKAKLDGIEVNANYTAVDAELSETSENPVQNKVITKALNEMGGGGSSTDIGDIKITACSNAPAGWLTCDGSAISRTDYSNLFSAIGTTYGSGDGSTTFNIPNLKGRVVVGIDGSDTDFSAIGKTGGEKAHRLTVNEMPSHTHGASYYTIAQPGGSSVGKLSGGSSYSLIRGDTTTSNTGNGTAHNNLQPYMALNYIIYTGVM